MSERGNFRGRAATGGRGGGRGDNSNRGGRGGNHSQAGGSEKPKKENILDLTKYMDKEISVKFNGGREGKLPPRSPPKKPMLTCPLKYSNRHIKRLRPTHEPRPRRRQGTPPRYSSLLSPPPYAPLSLPSPPSPPVTPYSHPYPPPFHHSNIPTDDTNTPSTRPLGLIVARGTLLVLISPLDGSEQISNPFGGLEGEGEEEED